MTIYTINNISEIINGKIIHPPQADNEIRHLLLDSRKITTTENTLFFAIKSERQSGIIFISELYEKGIRNFIVSETIENIEKYDGANFILVENVLKALQKLATHHRQNFKIPVIGITGSNGKTIVKEWLYQLLREDLNIVRSPKSYNSQVGVPLSVWQMQPENDFSIFEAGISKPNEMEALQQIIQPTIGIFTNIGEAHAENFSDKFEKTIEKLKLFEHCETIIYCRDYPLIDEQMRAAVHFKHKNVFSWSRKNRANLQIGKVERDNLETTIQGIFNNDFISIKIPFIDDASIENSIHCWALMLFLSETPHPQPLSKGEGRRISLSFGEGQGEANKKIAERMLLLSPVAMRLELKEGINHCSIINDSYNSDIGSLNIALDFLNQQKQHDKRTLVLSDILQSGKNEEQLYKEVSKMLANKGIQRLIGIGEAISRQENQFNISKIFYKNTSDFLNNYTNDFFRNETILLKGARAFGFEEISKVLQQKGHETVLEINLNAIIHNLNYFRSRLSPNTRIMAMVKAFSYGSGSFEIANVLQFHRVDYLAVAYTDEGVELRKAGITTPVMVMNPEEQSFEAMLQFNLEPEIYSFRILNLFEQAIKRHPTLTLPKREGNSEMQSQFPPFWGGQVGSLHIKLDTGMHRLGFEQKHINELIVRLKNNKQFAVKSVFSHLAGSDEVEHDIFTREQIRKFTEMSDEIQKHFDYPILKHILNSAGIVRFPEATFDMVRLGIGLYGVGANEYEQSHLQNVSTLKTIISQIKNIPARETVGYSRKGVAEKDLQIATIPIGYADGLSRNLSNGKGKFLVNGRPAPVIGNVCMDMCMLDITGIPAKEGDEVLVFGEENPISKIAADLKTIPYEVLTGVSRRVKRVYYQE